MAGSAHPVTSPLPVTFTRFLSQGLAAEARPNPTKEDVAAAIRAVAPFKGTWKGAPADSAPSRGSGSAAPSDVVITHPALRRLAPPLHVLSLHPAPCH